MSWQLCKKCESLYEEPKHKLCPVCNTEESSHIHMRKIFKKDDNVVDVMTLVEPLDEQDYKYDLDSK